MTRTAIVWAVCFLVAFINTGCKKSESVTTTDTQEARSTAVDPAEPAQDVEEQSVVPYDRADAGAIEVRTPNANPVDWYDVLQNGKRAFDGNPRLLNSSIELPPGAYVVDVNRTQREVTIEAGKKTILWTGELEIDGEPSHAYWYPMQGDERRLSSNPPLLNSARALFPGTYSVFVYVSVTTGPEPLGEGEVTAGKKTVLQKK